MTKILMKNRKYITLQWIPSHVIIAGNEEIDYLTKRGTTLHQTKITSDTKTAKTMLKKPVVNIRKHTSQKLKNIGTEWKINKNKSRRH